jgi:adenosylmethionine-8-amino-7-oxononanoate aminotransferase
MDNNIQQRDARLIWHPFTASSTTPVLPVSSAMGSCLCLADGRKLIDGICSWWVINHGHGQPEIVAAIERQLRQLEQVIFAGFTHEPAVEVAESLDEMLGRDRYWYFFSDNGSTAVEVALKIALQWHFLSGKPRTRFLALEGSYHGDTFGAMAASSRSLFTRPFEPMLCEVTHVPLPTDDNHDLWLTQAVQAVESGQVAALIFEPGLQGAGGMRLYDLNSLDVLAQVCRAHGVLLIADEVLTGFGRTGVLFPALPLQPDLMCFSKGLTGGFLPLGLTAIRRQLRDVFNQSRQSAFFHGHSFTGNPLACAAAAASLKLFEQGQWSTEVRRIESAHQAFCTKLSTFDFVHQPRVAGSILAFNLDEDLHYLNPIGSRVYDWCIQRGVLIRPLGSVVYFMPPFCITNSELQHVYEVLSDGLARNWQS